MMKKQEDYKAILDSISDGVFTVDRDWKITSFNNAAEFITGIRSSDAIGSYCSEVFRSSLCGEKCALQKTLKEGKPIINKSCYFINYQGEKIPITLSTAVLKNASGQIIGGAETFRDMSEIEALKEQLNSISSCYNLNSSSPIMQKVYELIKVVAPTDSTVLINGATGTGKEVAARTIHEKSDRRREPFVAVNCAALPENLLESALFGHKRGAFTGAIENKKGLFSRAGKGTLFLDEIGDISEALQIRLLRVLQEHEYEPLGSTKPLRTEARIITATNKNLKQLIENGTFRQDLYYRLNVINIDLPLLRERVEDIIRFAELFMERFNKKHRKHISGINKEALSILLHYSWPGNIRELENTIERACIVCNETQITIKCFSDEIMTNVPERKTEQMLMISKQNTEKDIIVKTLEQTNNKLAAAKKLGIHKTTLFRKIKKYGIKK